MPADTTWAGGYSAGVFKRRRPDKDRQSVAADNPYLGLRDLILRMDPAEVQPVPGTQVWGAMMEMGYAAGVATLVCLADGTTSMYVSTGGGILGGGGHDTVRAANRAFLTVLAQHLALLEPEPEAAMPAADRVVIRAMTREGAVAAEAAEDDLGHHRHPLSPAFHTAHGVLTELRMITPR
jgi:hypothetical protein